MRELWILAVALLPLGIGGCKHTPTYVGTYTVVIDEKGRTFLEGMRSAALHSQRISDTYRAGLLKVAAGSPRWTITINADGTTSEVVLGHAIGGTYVVQGNRLIVTEPDAAAAGRKPDTYTFNEADQTLSMANPRGGSFIVFKKK